MEPLLPNTQLPTSNPSASNTTSSPAEVLAGLMNREEIASAIEAEEETHGKSGALCSIDEGSEVEERCKECCCGRLG